MGSRLDCSTCKLFYEPLFTMPLGSVEGDDGVVAADAVGIQGVFDGLADGLFPATEIAGECDIENQVHVDLALGHAEVVEG